MRVWTVSRVFLKVGIEVLARVEVAITKMLAHIVEIDCLKSLTNSILADRKQLIFKLQRDVDVLLCGCDVPKCPIECMNDVSAKKLLKLSGVLLVNSIVKVIARPVGQKNFVG